ncbi:MAG: nucleotidyltransferase domain-containing protein [bacterium]
MEKKQKVGKSSYHMVKNITNEIILLLAGANIHTRGLAKVLNINHVTIINKLVTLVEENIVDFKQKGKNKVYYLKKTVESRNCIIMAELYKMNKMLKMYPRLRKIIEDILKNPKIKLAILFGSYAKGLAHEESDIDVFVETKSRILKRNLENIDSRLSVKIGTFNRSNPLIREIEKNHVIIKGIELYYEKTKSF